MYIKVLFKNWLRFEKKNQFCINENTLLENYEKYTSVSLKWKEQKKKKRWELIKRKNECIHQGSNLGSIRLEPFAPLLGEILRHMASAVKLVDLKLINCRFRLAQTSNPIPALLNKK